MDTIPRFLLPLFLLAVTFTPGCVGGGVFFKERLVGRFAMWAVDGLSDNSLVDESEDGGAARVLIPPTVFAVGFNDQFIIAKRHPKSDDQIDRSTTEFYVVSVLGGQVHGPVDREKFSALRARLGVPASLDFSRVIEQLAYQPSNRRVLKKDVRARFPPAVQRGKDLQQLGLERADLLSHPGARIVRIRLCLEAVPCHQPLDAPTGHPL